MRIKAQPDNTGYIMWLSADDTYTWAHKPGAAWPGSVVSGWRLRVQVDSNGLCDYFVETNPTDISAELEAIIDDHLPAHLRHLWPSWGQPTFEERRAADRLEYLRKELRAERISYDELHELQSLVAFIKPDDVELLEAAGVPERSTGGSNAQL